MSEINKNRRNEISYWFSYGVSGVFLILFGITAVLTMNSLRRNIIASNTIAQISQQILQLDTQTSRFILRSGIPVLDRSVGEEDPFTLFHFDWVGFYWRLAANTKQATPQEIIKAQFPLLALCRPKPQPIRPPVDFHPPPAPVPDPMPEQKLVQLRQPMVFIFHTHTSESYLPASGKEHQLNKQGDIVKVGEYLQQTLEEKYGIRTLHCAEIHDQFPFRDSYKRSQLTVIRYLKEYPSLRVLLDVHRDATPGLTESCNIKGTDTATIMIVVGSDKMGLPHPNWKKNYEFALKFNEAINMYYPGLSNGIVISDARYNQHLSDHAIIVEFGNQNSRLDQVYRAVDLFAEILALTINQELFSPRITSTN